MNAHDRHRTGAAPGTSTTAGSPRAGGGATTRGLHARPFSDLPQAAPPELQQALAVQLQQTAATRRTFETDPFGLGPVQLDGAKPAEVSPEDTLTVAAGGVAGVGTHLPFVDTIQRSFGDHDVSGIEAHVGGAAGDAATAIGATAYATGNHVAFHGTPDLHTAAHEAAHVVQQRGGVQLKGGVGQAGDEYERHADAVADRVVSGESAEDLLGAPGNASAMAPAIQRKVPAPGSNGGTAEPAPGASGQRHTGLPMVDSGFTCDRGEGNDCFLTPAQRIQVQSELNGRLGEEHANFQVAASEARFELLLEKDSGWGFVAELLFNVASFTIVGGLVKGLSVLRKAGTVNDALALMGGAAADGAVTQSLKESAAALNVDMIETLLVHVSKGVRAQVKNSASSIPPEKAARAAFIDRIRQGHQEYIRAIRAQAPASLDDAQLLALVFSLDHSVDEYRDQLNDLLARYKAHGIDDLGENRLGRRQVARFRAYGQERLALVQMNHNREIFKYRGEPYHSDGRQVFLQWVDSDLQEAAQEMNELRNGTPPLIEAGHRLNMFGSGYAHGFTNIHGSEPRELNAWIDAAGGVDV